MSTHLVWNDNPTPAPVVWWTPDCGYLHVETAPLSIGPVCSEGVRAETEVPATEPDPDYFDDSPAEVTEPETDPEAETASGTEPTEGPLP